MSHDWQKATTATRQKSTTRMAMAILVAIRLALTRRLICDLWTCRPLCPQSNTTSAQPIKPIAGLTPKAMAADIGVPLHKGSAKYYKEVGLIK